MHVESKAGQEHCPEDTYCRCKCESKARQKKLEQPNFAPVNQAYDSPLVTWGISAESAQPRPDHLRPVSDPPAPLESKQAHQSPATAPAEAGKGSTSNWSRYEAGPDNQDPEAIRMAEALCSDGGIFSTIWAEKGYPSDFKSCNELQSGPANKITASSSPHVST